MSSLSDNGGRRVNIKLAVREIGHLACADRVTSEHSAIDNAKSAGLNSWERDLPERKGRFADNGDGAKRILRRQEWQGKQKAALQTK
ncbi:MAG: hypothetical protein ABSG21_13235 [Spirochaetia bacterium]|jgi:hypothetical protein